MQEGSEPRNMRSEDRPANEDDRTDDNRTRSDAGPDGFGEAGQESSSPSVSPDYVAQLEARTRAAEQQVLNLRSRFDELSDELQRQSEETRQRLNRATEERLVGSKAEFVGALLPVIDNFQRSLEAAREGGSVEALLDGLDRTLRGFESALAAIGVDLIRSVGERFDPGFHEAVDTIDVGAEEDGIVTREYSRGYNLGDRLLRPARVQVGRAATPHSRGRAHTPTGRSFI
jgi:molecular chaperone GrpE